ncbi:MAG: cytochrome c [Acidobacteria bacterium]|jgi:mono/diheme cytochrome c family protein|nr:cytochrome c [Acidobacteriota bacterium]
MKILKTGLILTAFALFIFACTENKTANINTINNSNTVIVANNTQPAATIDELASAKNIFMKTCVKCHKEDGTGGVTVFEDTTIKAPNFTSDKMKNEDDAEFIETIENGEKEDGMPAFKGKLSEEEIKNLVKFIRREFQGKQ